MSVVDLSTGENTLHEACSSDGDEKYALDEATRFINTYKPKEILLYRHDPLKKFPNSTAKFTATPNLIAYLELDGKNFNIREYVEKAFFKISYQKEFFRRVFPDHGMLNVIEYLDIERMTYARISYICLLDFAYQHNEHIINNIYRPKIYEGSTHLSLGNNAITQLNVLESETGRTGGHRFKSLFDVVNNTSTPIGRRYLRSLLNTPIINPQELQLKYDCTEEFINDSDLFERVESALMGIVDVERMQRRLSLHILHPLHFADLIKSYESVRSLLITLTTAKSKVISKLIPSSDMLTNVTNFLEECNKTFIMSELEMYFINDIQNSIFKKGIYPEIDEVQKNISDGMDLLNNICKVLSAHIVDMAAVPKKPINPNSPSYEEPVEKVHLQKNDRDGHFLYLTKNRAKSLQNIMKTLKEIKINDSFTIKASDMEYKDLPKNGAKIFIKGLSNHSDNIVLWRNRIMELVKDRYITVLGKLFGEYGSLFRDVTKLVAKIDFIKSNAKTAKMYNYTKPKIVTDVDGGLLPYGFIRCKQLRHPIVERINTDYEYISHDIKLGQNKSDPNDKWNLDGMLLFGINSVGKSTIMKAIGISVIMAQSGMFVPATSYSFSPYDSLFARITANDNIFKGLSSFALEMTELRSILKRTNARTLVIGDEVCRGTEHISGNAIVAATIVNLAKTGASFIFATHLHEIPEIKQVKELPNVKPYHLSLHYDSDKDELIFDRLLKEGAGDSIYGITIAKHIIHDNEFMKLAQVIKNDLMNIPNNVLNTKESKYNKHVYIDSCGVCGDRKNIVGYFETHHINFQKDCDDKGFVKNKPHVMKNQQSNLVPLCETCHQKVHDGKLEIKGYKQTSSGKQLDTKLLTASEDEVVETTSTKVKHIVEPEPEPEPKPHVIKKDVEENIQIDHDDDDDDDIITVTEDRNEVAKQLRQKKWTAKDIIKINSLKANKISLKKAKALLEKKYGMVIAPETIKRVWNGSY
jgi:DNA mismatch repair protein MutS